MFLSLTSHLEKYNTGEMGEVSCVVVNSRDKRSFKQPAPKYQAGIGDLLDTRDELIRLKHSKIPFDMFQRVFIAMCLFASFVLGCITLWVYPSPNYIIPASSSLSFIFSIGIMILHHNFFPYKPDSFSIDHQLGTIRDKLNEINVQWCDLNGDFKGGK